MTRKHFIESEGATCKNWTWSWSFVNHSERIIIFGAWDIHDDGQKALIFSEDWQFNPQGHQQFAYQQSREHVRLIEEDGYRLMTFPMTYSDSKKSEDGQGPAKIDGFIPKLTERTLQKYGKSWYATDGSSSILLAEEIPNSEQYAEGAKTSVTINAYERSAAARKACILHYGARCAVCAFDFRHTYGDLGDNFIHVHHVIPIGSIGKEYQIDPVKDLIPVCPNCHAMIHRVIPPLSVAQLHQLIRENK